MSDRKLDLRSYKPGREINRGFPAARAEGKITLQARKGFCKFCLQKVKALLIN
jgi:hypothetical protein